jgi:tRNA modification GTPase
MVNHLKPTITAIATPPGFGGVGIIRLSGPNAYDIAQRFIKLPLIPREAKFCQLFDDAGAVLDSAIVLYFKAPHSFTGEDVIEFQCHASPVMLDLIVKQCLYYGARLASPGEFSLTAFLNGKIDLVQAESIADLIHASSETSARMALRSLSGEFSTRLHQLESTLVRLRVLIEAGIDFSDEEVDILSEGEVERSIQTLLTELEAVQKQARQGSLMREGIRVVIAGRPNAGKSTVMNLLAGREVAIVTPIAGTTRDLMRESITIEGIPLILIDTAGLHETDCMVEQEGIRRAKQAIAEADLVLWIIDLQAPDSEAVFESSLAALLSPNVPILKVFNKIDCCPKPPHQEEKAVYIAAKTGLGVEKLHQTILSTVGYQPTEGLFIARRRHLAALELVKNALQEALNQIKTTRALEFIAEELRQAQLALNEITGEFSSDDLLGEIFSTFCIGK